ncbi:MAG: hypothetical protein ACOY93_15740 [Bacillota bacterium]
MRHHHVVQFECEVCGTRFKEERLATACEVAGRPEPRFQPGDWVRLIGGDYREQFPDRLFTVTQGDIYLEKPGLELWEEGEPGRHTVFYVLRGQDGLRITFVPEYHLAEVGRNAHANHRD